MLRHVTHTSQHTRHASSSLLNLNESTIIMVVLRVLLFSLCQLRDLLDNGAVSDSCLCVRFAAGVAATDFKGTVVE